MKRRDFYLNMDAAFQMENHQVGLVYGFGVQRAFLQARHFPQVSTSYGYRIAHKNQFQLFATNVFSYSTVKLGKKTHQRLHVFEEYIGFSYELGNKIRFKNAILGGLYAEKITPKMNYFVRKLSIGYQFTIGVLYAF